MHLSTTEWKIFFRLLAIFVTIGLTGWCLYKYILDEDVSSVEFVSFNDDEQQLYPALTISFWNPFSNEKLKTYGSGINTTTYSRFIQGIYWDDRMTSIDYDDVTVSLEDYMTEIGVQYGNFSTRIWHDNFHKEREYENMPSFYVSNRNGGSKCFSFTMPYVKKIPVVSFFVRINADIFPNGKRTPHPNFDGSNVDAGGFATFFHLPGEHLRSYFDKKYSWNSRENNTENYDMIFTVKNVEVLKRRNKFVKPCNKDWKNDDDILMDKIMQSIGCKPPHWKLNTHLKHCSTKQQIKLFRWPTYQDLQKFSPPCNVIEKLQYDYEELDNWRLGDLADRDNGRSWFGITVLFPEPSYKEIKQAQAYDIESFVGNVGGYVGLFLGYSLMCIPSWIAKMFRTVRQRGEKRLKKMGNERKKSSQLAQECSSIGVEISMLDENCNKEKIAKGIINVVRFMNERQCKLESKFKDIETKLDVILPAFGRTLDSVVTSETVGLWTKGSPFFLSKEVLI